MQTGLYLFNFRWQNCSLFGGNLHTDDAEYQAYLKQSREHMVKKQKILNNQLGHHFGVSLSISSLFGVEDGGSKIGVYGFYGYRFSEHWMLGAYAGVDKLSPTEVEYVPLFTDGYVKYTRPGMSFPVLATSRFYFGSSRFMPYLFTDIGYSISKYSGFIFNTGIGSDINFSGRHTINMSFGLGSNCAPGVEDEPATAGEIILHNYGHFALTLRIGYYF